MASTFTCSDYAVFRSALHAFWKAKTILVFLLLLFINQAFAAQVTLGWDSTISPQVAGYTVHYGTSTGSYSSKVDAGKNTRSTVTGLVEGKTYYFAVTAYDAARTQSGFSNETSFFVPAAANAPTANFTASKTTGAAPLSVVFTSTSTGTISGYRWNFGDGSNSTTANPTHSYATPGAYTVALTVTGPSGSNTQTKTNLITVSSSTPPTGSTAPVASFVANVATGPAPLTVNFTSTSIGSITAYAWTFGDGGTSTAQNPSHTFANAGSYAVTLKTSNAAGSTTQTKTITVTTGSTTTLRQGLVAAYSFDEGTGTTASDRSGKSNTGSISGATWVNGRFGKALSFNGTNSRVNVSDSSSLDLSAGMTIEAWVYPTATMSGWRDIVTKERSGGASYYLYANSDKNQPANGIFTSAENTLYAGTQIPVNAWTHLTATYDGGTQRLYVNGVQVASRSQTGAIQSSTSPLRIGGNAIWGEYFQGLIDEVRIYNRALSVSEIQSDMSTAIGLASTPPPTPTPSTKPGLVAAYSFDEGAGTTASDRSGHSNTGTVSGATWVNGRFGKALSFNGTNSRVNINDSASLDLSAGMTIEAWVYPTATMSGWRDIVMKERGSGVSYYLYANSDKNQPANGVFTSAEDTLYGSTQIPVNAWTHLTATYDGNTQRLYVNGVQVASRSQTGAIQSSTSPLRIGGNAIWGEYFQGLIDEVRIYNRALSVSEIQSDMGTVIGGAQ
ncbi:MAG: LamG-like jellyroll fold domain-containing protein [Pseudomonadota bacterium]